MHDETKRATWCDRLRRLTPARLLEWANDGRDARGAERRRTELGRRGWLVSWTPEPVRGWRARLSSVQTVYTIERTARTRLGAIERAWCAGVRMLVFRETRRHGRDRRTQ